MRFVVAGAGGVGGFLGARLQQAGHEVAWLARGRTLAALREALIVDGVRIGPQVARESAAELEYPDAVIVAVKLYDLEAAAKSLAPLDRSGLLVLPLQNGVEAQAVLAQFLPRSHVLKGMVSTKSHAEAPARIVCKSGFSRIRFGGDAPRERLDALAAALGSGQGVEAVVSPDIDADLWRKFVMLASFSAVSCLQRATIGQVLDNPAAYDSVLAAVAEATAVATTQGVRFTESAREIVDSQVRGLPRDGKPSMLEDLEAGRPLELDFLSGTIMRLGERHGIPTPVHSRAFRALSAHTRRQT